MPITRVVNASPLVFLAREGLVELLREGPATEVIVPRPVLEELESHGLDDPTVAAIRQVDWLRVIAGPDVPPEIAAWDLGRGESSVLAVGLATPNAWAVIDDREARRCAQAIGLPCIGTLGLILLARRDGRIDAARPVLERLRASGMYLSERVLSDVLRGIGE